jgi:hypothetical protein
MVIEMYKFFITFCLLLLFINLVYLFTYIVKYYKIIKKDGYKVYYNNTLFNLLQISLCTILFISNVVYYFINTSLTLIPSIPIFLALLTSRIGEYFILVSKDSIIIQNNTIMFSSIKKVEYKTLLYRKNLLLIYYNDGRVYLAISDTIKKLFDNIHPVFSFLENA